MNVTKQIEQAKEQLRLAGMLSPSDATAYTVLAIAGFDLHDPIHD